MERIVIAFEQDSTSQKIRRLLESAGVARPLCCHTAAEVKTLLAQQRIPTVICGFKLPDGTAEELFFDLPAGRSMLLIASESLLSLCWSDPRLVCLSTPLTRSGLIDGVRQALQAAEADLRPARSEEEEVLIRLAKERLMARSHISEEQAHRLLQKKSMESGRKLSATARLLLEED